MKNRLLVFCVFINVLLGSVILTADTNVDEYSRLNASKLESAISSLLEFAAREEYIGLESGECQVGNRGYIGGQHFEAAAISYYSAYQLLKSSAYDIRGDLSSIICSRFGWFIYQTKSSSKYNVDVVQLIKDAIAYDKNNAIAHYMLAKVYDRENSGKDLEIKQLLEKSILLDESFPRAYLELVLINGRESDLNGKTKNLQLFFKHLKDYKTELYFFDNMYPPSSQKIIMSPPDKAYYSLVDKNTRYLVRKLYHENNNRFSLE